MTVRESTRPGWLVVDDWSAVAPPSPESVAAEAISMQDPFRSDQPTTPAPTRPPTRDVPSDWLPTSMATHHDREDPWAGAATTTPATATTTPWEAAKERAASRLPKQVNTVITQSRLPAVLGFALLGVLVAAVMWWYRSAPTPMAQPIPAVAQPTSTATTHAIGARPAGGATASSSANAAAGATGASSAGSNDVAVHIVGAVKTPGVQRLTSESRVQEAIDRAGGLIPEADSAGVNLARKVVDGEQIKVPRKGEAPQAESGPAAATAAGTKGGTRPPGAKVNLNTAAVAELETLPGVGPALAQRIVEHRANKGPFRRVADLDSVSGIGPAMMAKLADQVTV